MEEESCLDEKTTKLVTDARDTAWMVLIFTFACLGLNFLAISNMAKFDTVDWNPISLSLTVLQILLAMIAFAGFWMLRNVARDAATKAAKECSPACIDDWLTKNMVAHLLEYFREEEGRRLVESAVDEIQKRKDFKVDSEKIGDESMENMV